MRAQGLTDEGRLTTLDVHIIEMHAIQTIACPAKRECFLETSRVLSDLRSLRARMEKFFKSQRLESERLAINADTERLAKEYERVKRKYLK